MHFAPLLPVWILALLAAAAIGGVALFSYRRPLVPLTPVQRGVLIALRASGLALVVLCLCRPIVLRPPSASRDIVVPVLVDVSRSMAIADAGGQARLARAVQALKTDILPALAGRFTPEIYGIGDGLNPVNLVNLGSLTATARQSALTSAIAAVRERYRGRRISGIVLISDGGETTTSTGAVSTDAGVPVFTIGVGSPDGVRDREVVGMTAGDPRLDQASVDLDVIAVSRGYGRAPFDLRVLANGRPVETRRLVPAADGSPIDEVFTVSPDPLNPTVFSAEIAPAPDEAIADNNARSVLVSPAGRKRRVLVLEGAPGFEHSFLTRALSEDTALEIDSVVRKGKNDVGQDTFFVQAGAGRAAALTAGFPAHREDLYAYDALILANVEGDFFTRAQLAMAADFVSARGGGLLVLGGRSFDGRSLIGTPLEDVIPVELGDRRGAARTRSVWRKHIGPEKQCGAHAGGRESSDHAPWAVARGHAQAVGGAPAFSGKRGSRRPQARRDRAGRDDRRRRGGVSGRRRPALRQRAFDGVWRRSVVALADAPALDRSELRVLLASGGSLARRTGA